MWYSKCSLFYTTCFHPSVHALCCSFIISWFCQCQDKHFIANEMNWFCCWRIYWVKPQCSCFQIVGQVLINFLEYQHKMFLNMSLIQFSLHYTDVCMGGVWFHSDILIFNTFVSYNLKDKLCSCIIYSQCFSLKLKSCHKIL